MSEADTPKKKLWFPAKTYGWGWGPPTCWQGWLVLLSFCLLITLASLVFSPDAHPLAFFASVTLLSGVLIGICWLKGEPPRWRWGK